jgi:hypothetical protein
MMYPTPGTQMAIGSLPALWLALAMLGEWLRGLRPDQAAARVEDRDETAPQAVARREEMQSGSSAPLFGLFATSIAAVTFLTLGLRAHAAFSHWNECEPLGLAGAAQLRLPPDEAAERRAAAHYLMQHGTTFIASPTGCCSFYLWTELPPPTHFNTTYWEVLLTEEQQRDVVVSMEMSKTPLLLIDHGQTPVRYTDSRLHQYLTGRYKTIWRSGRFEVRRIRSNRQAFY